VKKTEKELANMYNFKITGDQNKDNVTISRASNSKPSGASSRDFQKVLGEKERRQKEEEEDSKKAKTVDPSFETEALLLAEEIPSPKQPSLFDLSKEVVKKKNESETSEVAKMVSSDELPMESPNGLYKNLALKEKASRSKTGEGMWEESHKDKVEAHEDKKPIRFSQEAGDLSHVNPLALNVSSSSQSHNQNLETNMPSQKLTTQQLIDAIVKAITTIDSQGKTDTIVTLKHPPMFAGANLVLTSYESAKGEFNIRFENLTQGAKSFMDMQQNQQSLLSSLNEKGYTVHMVVATTQIETPPFNPAAPQQPPRDGQQEEQQKRQDNRKQKEDEES
jgi:hypothetical protein